MVFHVKETDHQRLDVQRKEGGVPRQPWSLLIFTDQDGEKEPAKENTGQTGEDTESMT